MSDEQTPPPPALRLKPRLRPPEAPAQAGAEPPPAAPITPAPTVPPEPAAAPVEAPPAAPKIRFKPRLIADAPANPAAPSAEAPAAPTEISAPTIPPAATIPPASQTIPPAVIPAGPAAVAPAAADPASSSGGAAPGSAGAPRIRLKARVAGDAATPPPPSGAPAPADSQPAPPATIPHPSSASVPAFIPAVIPAPVAEPIAVAPAAPPPAVIAADTVAAPTAAGPAAEAGKFKLKPKGQPPAMIGGVPIAPASATPPAPSSTASAAPAAPDPAKAPPPFPVVAPAATGKTTPPIPHVAVKSEVPEPEAPRVGKLPRKANRGLSKPLVGLAAVLVLGAGGFFVWQTYFAESPVPPPVTKKAPVAAPATKSPPAASTASTPPAAGTTPAPTPSETLNQIAAAPGNAIQKAQDAISARRQSGQTRVDAAAEGLDVANRPAVASTPTAPPPAATATTGTRALSPGLSATVPLESVPDASPAFRSFVAMAKIGGVVVDKAVINGRLARSGEVVEPTLGITFQGYSPESKTLLFKDRSGATVARRYP